jgi:hypothetical protein
VADLTSTRAFGAGVKVSRSGGRWLPRICVGDVEGGDASQLEYPGSGSLLEGAVQQGGGVTVRWPRFAVCHLRILRVCGRVELS